MQQQTYLQKKRETKKLLFKALKSRPFLILYTFFFFSMVYPQYIFVQFKVIGQNFNHNDLLLTSSGSIAMVFNSLGRLSGGVILDYYPARQFFSILMISSIILSLTLPLIAHQLTIYSVYLCNSNYIAGSIFVAMPTHFAQIFGSEIGSSLYPYCFTANSFSTLILALLVYEWQYLIGFTGMLKITAFSASIAFFTALLIKDQEFYANDICTTFDAKTITQSLIPRPNRELDFTVYDVNLNFHAVLVTDQLPDARHSHIQSKGNHSVMLNDLRH